MCTISPTFIVLGSIFIHLTYINWESTCQAWGYTDGYNTAPALMELKVCQGKCFKQDNQNVVSATKGKVMGTTQFLKSAQTRNCFIEGKVYSDDLSP